MPCIVAKKDGDDYECQNCQRFECLTKNLNNINAPNCEVKQPGLSNRKCDVTNYRPKKSIFFGGRKSKKQIKSKKQRKSKKQIKSKKQRKSRRC